MVGATVGVLVTYLAIQQPVDAAEEEPLLAEDIQTDEVEKPEEDELVAELEVTNSKPEDVNDPISDSLELDTTTMLTLNLSDTLFDDVDDIIVLEDRLVGSRHVGVLYIDKEQEGLTDQADSALAEHLDIKSDERANSYEVEFWKSPINYSGYRLGKNKLILFGIATSDTISLYGMEETIYLHTTKGLYELNRCDEFEKLRKVNDEDFVGSIVNEN